MLPSVQKFQQTTLSRQAQFPRSNVTESPVVPGGGGGVLPVMAETRRLRPKEVPVLGLRYMKG